MDHGKRKAELKKEVNMESERKQEELKQLVNFLKCKWQYANNTVYVKEFRTLKLVEMINEITYFLYDESAQLSRDDNYILLSFVRAVSAVIDEKTPRHKKILEERLKDLEALSV